MQGWFLLIAAIAAEVEAQIAADSNKVVAKTAPLVEVEHGFDGCTTRGILDRWVLAKDDKPDLAASSKSSRQYAEAAMTSTSRMQKAMSICVGCQKEPSMPILPRGRHWLMAAARLSLVPTASITRW